MATHVSRYVINGGGFFSTPKMPDVEGLADFEGLCIHSSAWPADIDLRGKRVAFIGWGASRINLADW